MMEKRNAGYDIIRIIAIFCVIAIHGLVAFLSKQSHPAQFAGAMALSTLFLVGAPLFLMVSGALLLDDTKVISVKELFSKRIPKQLIPFLLWSVIYIFAKIVMGKAELGIKPFISLINTPAHSQFWFMYVLLGIYLILPLLNALVSKADKRVLEYFLVLWLIFSLGLRFTDNLSLGALSISAHLNFLSFFTYPGYFVFGYYLKKYKSEVSASKSLVIISISLAITLLISLAEWYICEASGTEFHGVAFRSYYCPALAIGAGGIFTLLSNLHYKGASLLSVTKKLSECTVGVFYIHMLVMAALELIPIFNSASLSLTLLKILIAYIVSYACSVMISYIPFINKLLMGFSPVKKQEQISEGARL